MEHFSGYRRWEETPVEKDTAVEPLSQDLEPVAVTYYGVPDPNRLVPRFPRHYTIPRE